MKRFITGILFFAAIALTATLIYFIVMLTDTELSVKLIFSGFMLLLALIVGIYASAVARRSRSDTLVDVVDASDKGCAVYDGTDIVYENAAFSRMNADDNEYIRLSEDVSVGKKTFTLVTLEKKLPEIPVEMTEEIGSEISEISEEEKSDEDKTE